MSIKDLPHVTVEQVLVLRKAAIELEQQLADLKADNEELKAKWEQVLCENLDLSAGIAAFRASLPKVRADAVNGYHSELIAATKFIFHPHFEGVKAVYFGKLEQDNE